MRGRPNGYSDAELAFIRERADQSRAAIHAAFCATFGRTDVSAQAITSLCKRYGWSRFPRLTDAQRDAIRRRYPHERAETIAEALGLSLSTVYSLAAREGLQKADGWRASAASGCFQPGERRSQATQFRPGQASPNKGLRRPGWHRGRMRETQFKPEQRSHTWKPIGSTKTSQGYSFTKVSDVRGVPWLKNWRLTHVLNWEAVHGPVPPGMVLKSRDGNGLNVDPANWELIERALLPLLNGGRGSIAGLAIDAAPLALRPTILAAAKLKRAIGQVRRRQDGAT